MRTFMEWAAVVAMILALPVMAEEVPFNSDRWQIAAQESELASHLGREALKLKGGKAWLPDFSFRDGTVTFDMAFANERGFAGLLFRMEDERNFEHFYLRPHRSGYPDANQYTPVFNGVSGWQLYTGENYSAVADYSFGTWIPVKIVVAGSVADVYVGDMDTRLFHVPELERGDSSGALGVDSSAFSAVWFSNFRIDPARVAVGGAESPAGAVMIENVIGTWQISDEFDRSELEGVMVLDRTFGESRTWSKLQVEPPGFANIARIRSLGETTNTVFARLVIDSPQARPALLEFGYSDLARVYFNGRLLYSGDNTYMTRDFRYLGTIGLFDAVGLHLQAGTNEVWIAVTEQFGGWGIMGRLHLE